MLTRARGFLGFNVGFIVGTGVGSLWTVPALVSGGTFTAALLLLVIFWGRRRALFGLMILGVSLGFIRMDFLAPTRTAAFSSIAAEGFLIDEPTTNRQQTFTVELEDGRRVAVTAPRLPAFHAGDRVRLQCDQPTPVTESRSDRLVGRCRFPEIQTIASDRISLLASLTRFRVSLEQRVGWLLPEPAAAFLGGLLFGSRSGLPPALLDAFNRTGTTHIVALSGYNVTILAVFVAAALSILPLGRRVVFVLTLVMIAAFILMTGASPSVVRAGLMGGLVLVSRQVERVSSPRYLLALAAAVMLAVNPSLLTFDRSFELSFAATAGLLFISPWLVERLRFVPTWFSLRETAAATLSATAATFPIIFLVFGRISLVGLVANLLILPLIPFAMGFGFLAIIVSFVAPPIAAAPASAARIVLSSILSVVGFLSGLPFAAVTV